MPDKLDLSNQIVAIEKLANEHNRNYSTAIHVITHDEVLEFSTINDLLSFLINSGDTFKSISIIFEQSTFLIAVMVLFDEVKLSFVLMLESKEKNKLLEKELKEIFKVSKVYDVGTALTIDSKMVVQPIFNQRRFIPLVNSCFILMPFQEKWSDRVNNKLKDTLKALHFEAKRADDLFGNNVLEDIWTAINESELIIADLTKKNPNVFYEIGIAHTLGKDVILLTQNIDDVPFDFKIYRLIEYEVNTDGFDLLEKKLRQFVNARKGIK